MIRAFQFEHHARRYPGPERGWAGSLLILIATMLLATPARPVETSPALTASTNTITAGSSSYAAGLSADGRFVLFLSRANNLVDQDDERPNLDVFLRDRNLGTTKLVSLSTNGLGGGSGNSSSPTASADGRWVVFTSTAANLATGDRNEQSDIFLRDVTSGTTSLISASRDGGPGNRASDYPQISANGRYIVFESLAGDLVPAETNSIREIFRADRAEGRIERISSGRIFPHQVVLTNGPAQAFTMTPDAERIVYVRHVTNWSGVISGGEIFGWDAHTSNTVWISSGVLGNDRTGIPAACAQPVISADGTHVVFKATNGASTATLYRQAFNPTAGVPPTQISRLAVAHDAATISHDGRFVAYEAQDGIHLWDGQTETDRLILGHLSGEARRICSKPALSTDGGRLAFYVASNDVSVLQLYDPATEQFLSATTVEGLPASINDSQAPLLSADGRTIAFDSTSGRLVENDANQESDVFVFSAEPRAMECVSVRAPASPSQTPPASSFRWPGSVSAGGNIIAVSSYDLGGLDTNRLPDLQVHDRMAGTNQFVGHPTNSTAFPNLSADGHYLAYLHVNRSGSNPFLSQQPATVRWRDLRTGADRLIHSLSIADNTVSTVAISPDGMRVAFVDRGKFSPSPYSDIYLMDVRDESVTLVSVEAPQFGRVSAGGQGDSTGPRFSPDGRWLFFSSNARNLTTETLPATYGLFARDLDHQETRLLASTFALNCQLAISGDSRWVSALCATASTPGALALIDLVTGTRSNLVPSAYAQLPSLSGDGRYLAFQDRIPSFNLFGIFVKDIVAGTNSLVTPRLGSSTIPASGPHSSPAMTPDGRYVIFASMSSNLVAGDVNGVSDVFIRDRRRNLTLLASVNRYGTGPGNGPSILPVLSANGRTVIFQSAASDLIDHDSNEATDVFVLELGGPDTDGDGLDDDWEMAYFNTLDRDGAGDFDGDLLSDRAEHQLGTDPTDRGSVFQVMTVTSLGANRTRLMWNATPGRTYRVQYRDGLAEGNWVERPELVTAGGTTATWIDTSPSTTGHRFYRVVTN